MKIDYLRKRMLKGNVQRFKHTLEICKRYEIKICFLANGSIIIEESCNTDRLNKLKQKLSEHEFEVVPEF